MNKRSIMPLWLCVLSLFACTAVQAQSVPDPGLIGPHTVIKAEYNLGDTVYLPPPAAVFTFTPTPDVPSQKMEVAGCVHYPSDLSAGPYPVIVFLHGMHDVCYDLADHDHDTLAWPCPSGFASIPSYNGYDYLGKTLASNGYIVISISSNAINAINNDLSDAGMNARGVLIQHHLDLWNTWNTTGGGPFGSTFVGALDMKRVGTMGHSRGGEGVIYNAEYNASLGSPYGIKAVLPLAPVDFFRHFINNIPLMDVAPYCDGDVSDLEGVHYYDDTRYNVTTDQAPKHLVLFMGANHNFFNTVWTPNPYIGLGADDWADYGYDDTDPHCGTGKAGRFDTTKQKAALNAYLSAFFRVYLGNETKFAPIISTPDIAPPSSSTLTASDVHISYHPGYGDRLDVNRTDAAGTLTTNTVGGAVTEGSLFASGICGGGLSMANCYPGSVTSLQKPHEGDASTPGLAQTRLQWNASTQYYENDIPQADQDITGYHDLIFRAAVNFRQYKGTPDLDFTVQLIDSAGNIASQPVSMHNNVLYQQPGVEPFDLPKSVMNTIRMPLIDFSGADMSRIRQIKFLFDKSGAGAITVSDISFSNPVCGNMTAVYKYDPGSVHDVHFTNSSTAAPGDTVFLLWNFGDPASGAANTSTATKPIHTYPAAAGTYTVCLYVKMNRKVGAMVSSCTDTFCSTVTLANVGVQELGARTADISIIPNPAKDYLRVNGAAATDVLRLTDLYGRVVLIETLIQPVVHLPSSLAAGVYYATVATASGNVYQKILINR